VGDAVDQLLLVVSGVIDRREAVNYLLAVAEGILYLLVLWLRDNGRVQQQDIVNLQQSNPDLNKVILLHMNL
jgi:hypothetical protein